MGFFGMNQGVKKCVQELVLCFKDETSGSGSERAWKRGFVQFSCSENEDELMKLKNPSVVAVKMSESKRGLVSPACVYYYRIVCFSFFLVFIYSN